MSDYIPQENLVQILRLLPVKSILRFRCVCKWWKEIIDSPSFMQQHLTVQKPCFIFNCNESEFLSDDPRNPPIVETLGRPPIEDEDEAVKYRLVGTLHGVVCLYDDMRYFLLWNPSIRKLLSINLPESAGFGWGYGLAIDAYSAFWIDPSTKCFKIVNLQLFYDNAHDVDGVLYSSIEQGWVRLPLDEVTDYRHFQEGPPLMIEGVAYWRARSDILDDYEGWKSMTVAILCFDFVRERFNVIGTPHVHKRKSGWYPPIPCNVGGTLSLVYWQVYEPNRCDVYSRQQGSWVKMFGFNLLPHIYHVFWVSEEMEERVRALAKTSGALVLYDSKGGCVDLKSGLDSTTIPIAHNFVESLLFPLG